MTYERFGTALKLARVAARKSIKETAKELNVTPTAITFWESGRAMPRADSFLRVCQVYGVQPADFFDAVGLGKVRNKA